ncbi:unnamed protein product [Macrosiphum euphorbiae]|uniref:Spaetzle domain-containing protein n=1 Tax=Macrosiphum euphorbiae TaxID=13131 RepID=A0AAV0XKJ4_9HEMI|nr:unnamed protein product [Macrosiphum euphorbiae]
MGNRTTCVQKYIYKKLCAIKDSNKLYNESFKIPSHCEYMYSKPADMSIRFNLNPPETSKTNNYVLLKKN